MVLMVDMKGRKEHSICIFPLVSVQPSLAAMIYQRLYPSLPSGSPTLGTYSTSQQLVLDS